jgi:O-6-methylguanine DNA methyltransferase
MKPIAFQTTWGRIALALDDSQRAVKLTLPALKTPPREPFRAKDSRDWKTASEFFRWLEEKFPPIGNPNGTVFQQAVWNALKKIPCGQTRTYGEIATTVGKPKAVRAVGSACGANPLPVFIPCHRVTAKNGLGGFSSGLPWKKLLLDAEASNEGKSPAICTVSL